MELMTNNIQNIVKSLGGWKRTYILLGTLLIGYYFISKIWYIFVIGMIFLIFGFYMWNEKKSREKEVKILQEGMNRIESLLSNK